MTEHDDLVAVAAPYQKLEPQAKRSSTVCVMPCLVASINGSRRKALASAAVIGGWEVHAYEDAQSASEAAETVAFKLAVVDLDTGDNMSLEVGFRGLTQQLAGTPEALLIACGHVDNPAEEIWARQQGIWLYLPGIPEETDQFSAICEEAMDLVVKQSGVHF